MWTSEPVTRQTSIDEVYFTVGILTLGISIVPDHLRSVLGSTENRPRKYYERFIIGTSELWNDREQHQGKRDCKHPFHPNRLLLCFKISRRQTAIRAKVKSAN
jgi:hypothetical protein